MKRSRNTIFVILSLTVVFVFATLSNNRPERGTNRLINIMENATVCEAGEEPEWLDYKEGNKRASLEKKPIMINFHASWCPACKEMEKDTLSNPLVKNYLKKNFISIRVDADKEKELCSKYRIRGLPTTWFLEHTGAPITHLVGYVPPEQFIEALKYIEGKYYKNLTFQDFLKRGIIDGRKGK
ncbi:MAG: thioredoxin fold domain-containing protein [Desulfobacterales bacterium]|nr:thioredoxin fold domain-containing protein [Desulfobacterales bacterium]